MVLTKDAHSSDEEGTVGEENQMDVDEGGVTEAQRKVAEAAGLGEQVAGKDNKKTRWEKKARRMFAQLGLKHIPGITKVCIRKANRR